MGILVTSPRPYPPPPPAVPWPGVAAMQWLVPDLVPEGDAPEDHALNLLDPKAHGLMLVQNGVRGLGMPKVQRWAATAPAVQASAEMEVSAASVAMAASAAAATVAASSMRER